MSAYVLISGFARRKTYGLSPPHAAGCVLMLTDPPPAMGRKEIDSNQNLLTQLFRLLAYLPFGYAIHSEN